MPVRAEVPTHPGIVFEGVVSALNVALDASSRAMAIEVRFPNADGRLMPGMFGTAEIHLPATERGLLRAGRGRRDDRERPVVRRLRYRRTRRRALRVVQVGEAQNGMVRILAGLEGSAVVATSASIKLFDGARVRCHRAGGGGATSDRRR